MKKIIIFLIIVMSSSFFAEDNALKSFRNSFNKLSYEHEQLRKKDRSLMWKQTPGAIGFWTASGAALFGTSSVIYGLFSKSVHGKKIMQKGGALALFGTFASFLSFLSYEKYSRHRKVVKYDQERLDRDAGILGAAVCGYFQGKNNKK